MPCNSVVLARGRMAVLSTDSTRADVGWTAGVQNVWMTLAHTAVTLAGDLRIVANPRSEQIRGAVSIHQGSLTL